MPSQNGIENPKKLASAPDSLWPAHPFTGRGHDIIAADVNGDDRQDIVTYGGKTVLWFDTSVDMQRIDIGAGEENYGGVAPRGAEDLDGDIDIISKIWNKDGATYHVYFWRNDTPQRTSDAPK